MSDGKAWAWAGFLLGTGVSVAGNVAHTWHPTADVLARSGVSAQEWQPTIGAQAVAAFYPLALLITVEVLARVPWPSGWGWATARFGGASLVALVAAVVSYGHLYGLLTAYGETTMTATIGPLAVDGLMVVSGFALLAISRVEKGYTLEGRAGTPTDSPVPVVAEEPVPAPEIRHAGAESATVPGPRVHVPEAYPQPVPAARVRAGFPSPWGSFDGPSDGTAALVPVAEIRLAETDFAAARDGQTRARRTDLAAAAEEGSAEWVRLVGLYPDGVPEDRTLAESGSQLTDFATPPDSAAIGVPDEQVRVPGPHPDIHQVQAVKVFSDELADGQVPSVRRIKTTLKVGQPKAEQVRDYLRRLVDAQPADGERVGADVG